MKSASVSFLEENEELAPFVFSLEDTIRQGEHTLSDETEQALSYFSQSFDAPSNIYSLIANSDIPFPTITLSSGDEAMINAQGYSFWRGSENRDDRKLAFDAYWGKWAEYNSSVGMVLNSHVQMQVALAKARKFDSVLQRELFNDNLPETVYHSLVEEVNKALAHPASLLQITRPNAWRGTDALLRYLPAPGVHGQGL